MLEGEGMSAFNDVAAPFESSAGEYAELGYNSNQARTCIELTGGESSNQNKLAPRHGFEPRFTAPKAAVLPLDDRGSQGANFSSVPTAPGSAPFPRDPLRRKKEGRLPPLGGKPALIFKPSNLIRT